ncbi:hypothetical protein FDJ19_gp111 [Vibrio phage Ceto]|uniref:Uncharacterized protein n=1 Tax=Vibrio phage Ceto TaxID=2570300 RepID=A0A2H5BGR5_9CAUD|nr:hypothetical protein FDJ19_gp002 [Vibrio phage Ceto]YP_009621268.1 hypothetical protein FDJ19_gp111 [Vibrio phage Ceto]AUG85009.1 hypothetical protein CETO_2 [Vibrio phage Ceto]AUG85187.1 hypothetical protein CETO_205 [Vibrio phage Ceto]
MVLACTTCGLFRAYPLLGYCYNARMLLARLTRALNGIRNNLLPEKHCINIQ